MVRAPNVPGRAPWAVGRLPRTPAGGSYPPGRGLRSAGRWPLAAGRWPLAAGRWPGIPAGGSYPPGPIPEPRAAIPGPRSPGRWPPQSRRVPRISGQTPPTVDPGRFFSARAPPFTKREQGPCFSQIISSENGRYLTVLYLCLKSHIIRAMFHVKHPILFHVEHLKLRVKN